MLSKLLNQFQCSTMMLPEHVEALSEHRKKKDRSLELRVPKIEQQQYEEWERLIKDSLAHKSPLHISYILNDRKVTVKGYIEQINITNKTIFLRTPVKIKAIPANRVIFIDA